MNEQHNPWTINGEKTIYDNKWISVTEYDVLTPSGTKGIYGKVHFKNTAVGIVALDDQNRIYLVGQYRFVLNEYSWEIPEGGCPLGTDPLEGAIRELKEETGLVAASWAKIITMQLSNSVSDEIAHVYLARDLTQESPQPEDTEQLVTKKIPFEEAYEMVCNGTITDSMSVAAILKIKLLFP